MRILIVEDDITLAKLLKTHLKVLASQIFIASNTEEAKQLLKDKDFHMILCDQYLSKANKNKDTGLSLTHELRANNNHIPIIMLTGASSEELQSWDALDAGVDDFVRKPIQIDDLIARIRAIRRRPKDIQKEAIPIPSLKYKGYTLSFQFRTLTKGNDIQHLNEYTFKVLSLFFQKPEQVLSYADILEEVWGTDAVYKISAIHNLRTQILLVKKLFGADGYYIQNVYQQGYMLKAL